MDYLTSIQTQWLRLINYGRCPEEWGGWYWEHRDYEKIVAGRERFDEWVKSQRQMNSGSRARYIDLGPDEASCRLVSKGGNLLPRPNELYLSIGPSIRSIAASSRFLGVPANQLREWKRRYWLDHLVLAKILEWFLVEKNAPLPSAIEEVSRAHSDILYRLGEQT